MDCATGNVRIQDFIDCLLSLDGIETFEDVTDCDDEILAISSFDLNFTFGKFSQEKLLNLFQLQNYEPALLPVIENGINIVVVLRHESGELSVVLTTQVDTGQ